MGGDIEFKYEAFTEEKPTAVQVRDEILAGLGMTMNQAREYAGRAGIAFSFMFTLHMTVFKVVYAYDFICAIFSLAYLIMIPVTAYQFYLCYDVCDILSKHVSEACIQANFERAKKEYRERREQHRLEVTEALKRHCENHKSLTMQVNGKKLSYYHVDEQGVRHKYKILLKK